MTVEEFSNEFDTLLNSFGENNGSLSIKLDEYEKSVFLTKAQEEIIINLYSGKNPLGSTFEKTEEIRRYLDNLIKTYTTSDKKTGHIGLSDNSTFFELPEDLWFITYESVHLKDDNLQCNKERNILVNPITQDDYFKISNNPFRGPSEKRALRLDFGNSLVEIVSKYNIQEYTIRYISKPTPIILTDLPDDLSINDINIKTECKLNPVIHRAILERAVEIAILSRVPNTGK